MLKFFYGTAIFTSLNTQLKNVLKLQSTAFDSPMKLALYLKNDALSTETLPGFPAFVTGDPPLSNCHKLHEVSE